MNIKWWYFLTVGVVAIDLLAKYLLDGENFNLISGFISIVTVHNTGASWGVLAGAQWFFILISVLFAVGMILFDVLYKKDFGANGWYKVGYTLILGGLLGNLYDRIAFGYVRDFIHLDFMSFPVFNIADIALTVGCICIIVFLFFFCKFGNTESVIIKRTDDIDTNMQTNNAENMQTKKQEKNTENSQIIEQAKMTDDYQTEENQNKISEENTNNGTKRNDKK